MLIKYKGKELNTNHTYDVSDEMFKELKSDYYKKPSIDDVKNEIVKIYGGGTR